LALHVIRLDIGNVNARTTSVQVQRIVASRRRIDRTSTGAARPSIVNVSFDKVPLT